METRLLFPNLPPELRNLVYSYTVSEETSATNVGLSFKSKAYDSSHTKVTIMPIHHGNVNLLALQKYNFLEAIEYRSFLLRNAVELRIAVLFKGHMHTFIQEHWDKKVQAHLKNLMRKNSWMRRLMTYDIHIVWAPCAWACKSNSRQNIGGVAKRMVEVLTAPIDQYMKTERGRVKVGLHISEFVVGYHIRERRPLGLTGFVSIGTHVLRRQVREVKVIPFAERSLRSTAGDCDLPSYLKMPKEHGGQEILLERNGCVRWGVETEGCLVFRRQVQLGEEEDVTEYGAREVIDDDKWRVPTVAIMTLFGECTEAI